MLDSTHGHCGDGGCSRRGGGSAQQPATAGGVVVRLLLAEIDDCARRGVFSGLMLIFSYRSYRAALKRSNSRVLLGDGVMLCGDGSAQLRELGDEGFQGGLTVCHVFLQRFRYQVRW